MSVLSAPRLYLLRHAHSSWAEPGERDHRRPLDKRGRADAAALGATLRSREIVFDRIVCSSARRARQTLQALGSDLGAERAEFDDELYSLGPEAYLEAVRRCEGAASALIVGHNPTIGTFAQALCAEEAEVLTSGFPTCGLAIFRLASGLSDLAPGTALLEETIWPRSS